MNSKKKISRAKKHAKIEKLSFFGAIAHTGPTGLFVYAKDFLDSAKTLLKTESSFSPSRYHLILRSIELSLKAFLSCNGYSLEKLSGGQFAHDLIAILNECEGQNIKIIEGFEEKHKIEIRASSQYYVEKVFEYPALWEALRRYPNTPDISVLVEAAEILVEFIKRPCLEAINKPES